jgi:IS1 family transposase
VAYNLTQEKREAVIRCLVNGSSVRATERITTVHRDTILRFLVKLGVGCERLLNEKMQGLTCRRVQVDEIWGYVGKKQRHLKVDDDPKCTGDMWTFVAIDADSKVIPAYRIGKRDTATTRAFIDDLASRLTNRIQLSSDAMDAYVSAIDESFGPNVDYGHIVKSYEAEAIGPGRYSPPKVVSSIRIPILGSPDRAHISTSFIERQNLTMRMDIRRLTRLTNAFSKKLENLKAAVALHFAYYNFGRVHQTLRVTPAMEAGIAEHVWSIEEILERATV